MSHSVIVKDGGFEIMDVCVAGDLSDLYEKLKGAHDRGTNGEGLSEVTFAELETIVAELPQHPTSNKGIHIVQRCLAEMLDTNKSVKKFIFHLS